MPDLLDLNRAYAVRDALWPDLKRHLGSFNSGATEVFALLLLLDHVLSDQVSEGPRPHTVTKVHEAIRACLAASEQYQRRMLLDKERAVAS